MNQCVLMGDCHIREGTWLSRPKIRYDSYYSFGQIIDYCCANDAGLILAGDTFNSKLPSASDVEFFRHQLSRMQDRPSPLPVYIIQGQHDMSAPPWPRALMDSGVTYVDRQEFSPLPGLTLFGLDARKRVDIEAAMAEIPETCNGVLCHQLARQVFDKEGAWDFDATWLPPHITLALIGDFHEPIELEFEPGRWMLYTGSAHMCSIAEIPEKSFVVLGVADDGSIQWQRVPLVTRPSVHLHVNGEEDMPAFIQQMEAIAAGSELPGAYPAFELNGVTAEDILMPTVRVTFRTDVKDVIKRTAAFSEKLHIWPDPVIVSTMIGSNVEGAPKPSEATLQDCLSRFCAPNTEVFSLVNDLLSENTFERVFSDWRVRKSVIKKATC